MAEYVLTNTRQLNPLDVASMVATNIGIFRENVRYKVFASPKSTMVHVYNDPQDTFATRRIRPTMTLDVKLGGDIQLLGPATEELIRIIQDEVNKLNQTLPT